MLKHVLDTVTLWFQGLTEWPTANIQHSSTSHVAFHSQRPWKCQLLHGKKRRKLADISLYAGYWNELNAVMDSTKKIVPILAGRQIGFRPSQLLISPLHFEPEFLWPDSICYKVATKTVRSNKLCNWKLLNLVNSVLRFLYVPFVCTLYLCILLLRVP
jgi:hypothetical protein